MCYIAIVMRELDNRMLGYRSKSSRFMWIDLTISEPKWMSWVSSIQSRHIAINYDHIPKHSGQHTCKELQSTGLKLFEISLARYFVTSQQIFKHVFI